jgi:chemotaxis response regulator CheB
LDPDRGDNRLRVLIADESAERLAMLAAIVRGVGLETIAAEVEVSRVGPATAREHPDVALVAVGESNEHALQLISTIVAEAECPVIAVLSATDTAFVHEAAKRAYSRTSSTLITEPWRARSRSCCFASANTMGWKAPSVGER